MKQMQDFSNFILHQYSQVEVAAEGNLELPYVVTGELYYHFAGLIISEKPEDQEKAKDILKFINQVMNGDEYDDETKNMIYLEFIEMLGEPAGPNGKDLGDAFEHKKMRLAKEIFTGEALDWLRFRVLNSNEAYRYKFSYIFEEDAEIIIDRLKEICKDNVYFDPDIPEYIKKNQKISGYKL